jgi:hypothetical protein
MNSFSPYVTDFEKNELIFICQFERQHNGAAAGDMFMSLIYTCELSGANPLDYLTALQDYSALAQTTPEALMPWNYRDTILRLPKQG